MGTQRPLPLSEDAVRQLLEVAGIPLTDARRQRLAQRYERLLQEVRELDAIDLADAEPAVRFRAEG